MSITENLAKLKRELPAHVTLVAVTKTHPPEKILEAYQAGHRIFGENKVQELVSRQEQLPKDIEWHLIGHLQTNKVKYIAPFISLIHSVDSLKLLQEINKQALKHNRTIDCLLQIHIAEEETKFGLSFGEAQQLLASNEIQQIRNIRIKGLMGMATFTSDESQIRKEFRSLKTLFGQLSTNNKQLSTLSMGMSSDYKIAIEEGSTLVRVGNAIFGSRT